MVNLCDRVWKDFFIGSLFDVKRPKARSEKQYKAGQIPFVASGNVDNGVIRCCEPNENECLDDGKCITVSPVDGSAFYQEYAFLGRGGAGSSILLLYNNNLNRHSALFVSRIIRQTCSKYCYGKMGNQESIKREKIMLPVNEQEQIDYAFMEQYIREREKQLIQKYIDFVGKNIQTGGGLKRLNSLEWHAFRALDLFNYQRGNQNNMNSLSIGDDMLISAKSVNNGLKGFFTSYKENKGSYQGNCITLNNDGDGGVGLAYYQPHEFLLDTHVYALYPKDNMSKYAMLFISQSLSKQRVCFSHGYSISQDRLKKMKIFLPVNMDGDPDYIYMEQYGKILMLQKYQQYLDYIGA